MHNEGMNLYNNTRPIIRPRIYEVQDKGEWNESHIAVNSRFACDDSLERRLQHRASMKTRS